MLTAKAAELGTGVGPALREELLFVRRVREAEAAHAAAAQPAAAPPASRE